MKEQLALRLFHLEKAARECQEFHFKRAPEAAVGVGGSREVGGWPLLKRGWRESSPDDLHGE